jgi:hypothetical protein
MQLRCLLILFLFSATVQMPAQIPASTNGRSDTAEEIQQLTALVQQLQSRLARLEAQQISANITAQALKENTVTFDYNVFDGFLMRYECRRDFSNQPSFLTDTQGLLGKQQQTATVGLI